MFLPHRLLATEMKRRDCWREYLQYQKVLDKVENNRLRIDFLEKCKRADIIPHFLRFRIPNNGCFNDKSIHDFQNTLLQKELIEAKSNLRDLSQNLETTRSVLRDKAPTKCLPSIILHTRMHKRTLQRTVQQTHDKKLLTLSEEQNRPLFNVKNTVILCDLHTTPPKYVLETLSLGPKNSVLNKFESKDILMELDCFLEFCVENHIPEQTITDINVKTLNYIKKCKNMKESRNIVLTKKYLKEQDLLAVPLTKE